MEEYWMAENMERKEFMTTCYADKYSAAANVMGQLGSVEDVKEKLSAVVGAGVE